MFAYQYDVMLEQTCYLRAENRLLEALLLHPLLSCLSQTFYDHLFKSKCEILEFKIIYIHYKLWKIHKGNNLNKVKSFKKISLCQKTKFYNNKIVVKSTHACILHKCALKFSDMWFSITLHPFSLFIRVFLAEYWDFLNQTS